MMGIPAKGCLILETPLLETPRKAYVRCDGGNFDQKGRTLEGPWFVDITQRVQ